MATWVTHLMIADRVLLETTGLDRRGFCVGNIAPDCNVENEDWSAFTPPREVTHWMGSNRKVEADCEKFYEEYLCKHSNESMSEEQISFLAGYYAHLIVDAAFQKMIRDEDRVRAVWTRIREDQTLRNAAEGLEETWDNVKRIISKKDRMAEIYGIEREYLAQNPDSGYLTQILPLKEFPDYIEYLPHGCIVRKIGVMGRAHESGHSPDRFISISKEEHLNFVHRASELVILGLKDKKMVRTCT